MDKSESSNVIFLNLSSPSRKMKAFLCLKLQTKHCEDLWDFYAQIVKCKTAHYSFLPPFQLILNMSQATIQPSYSLVGFLQTVPFLKGYRSALSHRLFVSGSRCFFGLLWRHSTDRQSRHWHWRWQVPVTPLFTSSASFGRLKENSATNVLQEAIDLRRSLITQRSFKMFKGFPWKLPPWINIFDLCQSVPTVGPCQRFLVFEAAVKDEILSKLAALEEGSGTLLKEYLIEGRSWHYWCNSFNSMSILLKNFSKPSLEDKNRALNYILGPSKNRPSQLWRNLGVFLFLNHQNGLNC